MGDTLLAEAAAQHDEAVELRRRLHRHPELGLDLPLTQAAVLEAIDGIGLEDVTTGGTTSSVVARLRGDRPGPTLLLRADMDALPMPEDTGLDFASSVDGAMHACGHDAHVAMLVGAARLLAGRRRELAGSVLLMFQPGEEGHHGARFMLEEGLLDGVGDDAPSAAFALHITPTLPSGMVATKPGPMMASADVLRITITGRGGHASMPHQAVDPVPVACELVGALNTFITRRIDVFDPAVLTIASIEAGTTNNVIPEDARLLGTIRATSEAARARVLAGVRTVADGVAAAHECTATVEVDEGYPVTVNDDAAALHAVAVVGRLLGEAHAVQMPTPVMGAEDFSYVLQKVPGAMAFLGAHPGGRGPVAPNHSNRMLLDERAFTTGIAVHAAMALDHLSA